MSIIERYAGIVVDIDGVVFRGDEPVKEAVALLRRARRRSQPLVLVTNNSYRTAAEWRSMLADNKVELDEKQILSSADAAVGLLDIEPRPRTLVIGGPGLRGSLQAAGIEIVADPDLADAVVVGWDDELSYAMLRDASRAIQRGARFVGTNPDAVLPGADGPIPGNGAALAYLRATTGVAAEISGKPQPGVFELARDRLAVDGPILVVGDQIETDVVAAARMGWDSALVLSGVSGWSNLIGAPASPDWVVRHLGELDGPEPPIVRHARETDVSAIRALLEGAGFDVDGAARRLRETLVAEGPEGDIVGTIAWELLADAAHLRGITVATHERGHGAGSHLVVSALDELEAADVEWVYLLTPGADELFAKLGFFEVARDRVPPAVLETAQFGGEADGGHAMVRRLGRDR